MRPPRFSRAHDAQVLGFLAARTVGASLPRIAADFGVGVSSVQMATNQVLAADLAESGEPAAVVRGAYWRTP